jgi:hypothetical protein
VGLPEREVRGWPERILAVVGDKREIEGDRCGVSYRDAIACKRVSRKLSQALATEL